jgi:hypothetical protein
LGIVAVRIANLAEAARALDQSRITGTAVLLVTAAEVTAFAGVGYWRALERELDHPLVVDCGDDAGLAMAALRAGCRDLLFTGPAEVGDRLAGMAAQLEANLRQHLDDP